MNILVTGGAGFIGSHLIERLLEENDSIVCLDNFDNFYDPAIKQKNIEILKTHPNFKLIEGDIRDASLIQSLFEEESFDLIYHIAARAGVRPSINKPLLYQDVNIHGTLVLLEEAKKNQTRFIFASSSSVYGNNKKVPFSEEDVVDFPISPYAATKKSCELICYTYHQLYQIPILCLRFFTVYGPRQRPEMAIHKFTRMIYQGEKIPLYGDGSSKRDYTYIDDIIDGLTKAKHASFTYEILNLGESQTVELHYLIQVLENNIGLKANIERLPEQPGDVNITFANIEKARHLLGYAPKIKIEKGISSFVEWYRRFNNI